MARKAEKLHLIFFRILTPSIIEIFFQQRKNTHLSVHQILKTYFRCISNTLLKILVEDLFPKAYLKEINPFCSSAP